MARSAGSVVQLVAKDEGYGVLRLPSGEMRRVSLSCRATIGQVGNADHENVSGGKAGRSRWQGKRPAVRGSAMNPVDHPHGGGEGKSKGGRHPVTPWGVPTLGKRTRRQQARARVRLGADGRPQARRVRADADLPRPCRRQDDAGEEALVAKQPTFVPEWEVRAQARWVRVSPRKARVVAEHIRGRSVPEARTVLAFTQRAAAQEIEKVLRSAVANAEANHGLLGDSLVVSAAYVDEGPVMKRWRARARGRVARIKKPTCHITVKLVPAADGVPAPTPA